MAKRRIIKKRKKRIIESYEYIIIGKRRRNDLQFIKLNGSTNNKDIKYNIKIFKYNERTIYEAIILIVEYSTNIAKLIKTLRG